MTELPLTVLLFSVTVEDHDSIPPPPYSAILLLTVELVMVTVDDQTEIPPMNWAVFPMTAELLNVIVVS